VVHQNKKIKLSFNSLVSIITDKTNLFNISFHWWVGLYQPLASAWTKERFNRLIFWYN